MLLVHTQMSTTSLAEKLMDYLKNPSTSLLVEMIIFITFRMHMVGESQILMELKLVISLLKVRNESLKPL